MNECIPTPAMISSDCKVMTFFHPKTQMERKDRGKQRWVTVLDGRGHTYIRETAWGGEVPPVVPSGFLPSCVHASIQSHLAAVKNLSYPINPSVHAPRERGPHTCMHA
mmetsp:Transcript_15043/g.30448  ORF Transcript_15043/g.30448 Transcript_15043/m.30448 type:complete len:108 (-) Transcript_15043:626-949(-)